MSEKRNQRKVVEDHWDKKAANGRVVNEKFQDELEELLDELE